jgi:hypothetical protein
MARLVCGGAPPPSRGTRRSFLKPLRRKHLRDPPLERRSLCTPSGQRIRARREPARTGRGPSPARCGSVTTETSRTCPLRARSAGQRRGPTVTPGQPDMPIHLRIPRSLECGQRPSKQPVARSSPYGAAGGFLRPKTRRKMSRTRVRISACARSSCCTARCMSWLWNLAASTP